jgi:hypothetical protein
MRDMFCTLCKELLPQDNLPEQQTREEAESSNHVVVWDLDKVDWRSFRIDSLIDFRANVE